MSVVCGLDSLIGFKVEWYRGNPSKRQQQQAVRFANEEFVHKVELFKENNNVSIRGRCYASMRKTNKPHTIWLTVAENVISDSRCTCTAGIIGECAHVLALVKKIETWIADGLKNPPAATSCTSRRQEWGIPRGKKITPQSLVTISYAKTNKLSRKRKAVEPLTADNRLITVNPADLTLLTSMHGTPCAMMDPIHQIPAVCSSSGPIHQGSLMFYWTQANSGPPTQDTINASPDLSEANKNSEYESARCLGDVKFPKPCPLQFDWDFEEIRDVAITAEEAEHLERSTVAQSQSDIWKAARQKRITASNFGKIVKRKKSIDETSVSFLSTVLNLTHVTTAGMKYGLEKEDEARVKYAALQKVHTHPLGFVVNPAIPFIGASPDGCVCDGSQTGLVEIKCPASATKRILIEFVKEKIAKKKYDFCLEFLPSRATTGDDLHTQQESLRLKRSHDYYFQIQGNLLVTGADFCDFAVYTINDLHVERILPDLDCMKDLAQKMYSFYKDHAKKVFENRTAST